jgi:hypothetical protein
VWYDKYGAVKLFEISAGLSFISMIISIVVSIIDTKSKEVSNTLNDETRDDGYSKVNLTSDIELVGIENS